MSLSRPGYGATYDGTALHMAPAPFLGPQSPTSVLQHHQRREYHDIFWACLFWLNCAALGVLAFSSSHTSGASPLLDVVVFEKLLLECRGAPSDTCSAQHQFDGSQLPCAVAAGGGWVHHAGDLVTRPISSTHSHQLVRTVRFVVPRDGYMIYFISNSTV